MMVRVQTTHRVHIEYIISLESNTSNTVTCKTSVLKENVYYNSYNSKLLLLMLCGIVCDRFCFEVYCTEHTVYWDGAFSGTWLCVHV